MKNIPMTDDPCPRCLKLAQRGDIRAETVQRLPAGAWAPLDNDGNKQCFDCDAAEKLLRLGSVGTPRDRDGNDCRMLFCMARIATGSCRQEQYRLPGAPMGLIKTGHMKANQPGDFERHLAWLDANDWFGTRSEEEEGW